MRASRNGVFMQCENIVNGITYYKNYVLGAGEFGEWEFTSGMFDFGHLSGDKIRAVSLLCEINNGDAQVYLINENGQQKQIMSFDENGISCRRAIVPPMSGKLYKLRVCGHGDVKIYGLEIHAAKRGDMNG